ncbi:MAG: SGNH/GDSL hydrolase family protein [Clostridia bacterium]|nr:SGNH/GDSL hydrolase family protein [Clostridia bacterium]
MNYFNKYVSNTLASSLNQLFFTSDGTKLTGRVYYKAFCQGTYEYSFLFSDTVDSTYADGSISVANETSGEWTIHSARLVVEGDIQNEVQLTFNGSLEKKVSKNESFYTDPITVTVDSDFFIEIEFSGTKIPYFEEIIIPTKRLENGVWVDDKKVPSPSMVGIVRNVEKKIGFLGDSITEGIGTSLGSYSHWNAKIAEFTGEKYSYWNLGIGFARAADAATDGAWLEKAKQMDVVTICLGVNDLGRGYTDDEIKNNLRKIVEVLQENNVRTILFTIPPFDYQEETNKKWRSINAYILNELSKITEIYDVVPIWGQSAPNEHMARYGGHPNEEGCLELAKDFVSKIKL